MYNNKQLKVSVITLECSCSFSDIFAASSSPWTSGNNIPA